MKNDNRLDRYSARDRLNRISGVPGCADCGRARLGGGVGVRMRDLDGAFRAAFAGVATCGRVWLCPVCNAKVMATRAIELGVVLAWAESMGYSILWGSLTFRHGNLDRLSDLLVLQRAAWRRVVQSKFWTESSSKKGGPRIGYVRASEITIGDAFGWHPHFHPIVIVKCSQIVAQGLADELRERWAQAVDESGGFAMAGRSAAQQIEVLEAGQFGAKLAEYVTTSSYSKTNSVQNRLALEAVWSQSKTGPAIGAGRAHKTEAHWVILDDVLNVVTGEISGRSFARWREFEEATHGHRVITWSRSLRRLAGLGVEIADEVLAARELGSIEDTVCVISPAGWRRLVDLPTQRANLLRTLEQGGWVAARDLLDQLGVEWFTLDSVPISDESRVSTAQILPSLDAFRPGHISDRVWIEPDLFSSLLKLDDD